METVVSKDDMLMKILLDKLMEPCLKIPASIVDVLSLVRIILGEVRIGADEEMSAKASRDA
eukprot:12894373-Prorocentrum_lima.AAC.1